MSPTEARIRAKEKRKKVKKKEKIRAEKEAGHFGSQSVNECHAGHIGDRDHLELEKHWKAEKH